MNYKKGIIINSIILLLLSFSALALYKPVPETEIMKNKEATIPLLNYNVGEIAAVALINGESRFGLIHRNGEIYLEPSSVEAVLSRELLQSFLFRLSKLSAKKQIETTPEDFGKYSLDNPGIRSTLILESGEKIHLSLGKQNPLDGTYYLHKEGVDNLYIITKEDASLFLSKPSDFSQKQVLPRVDLADLNTVEYIQLSSDKKEFRIENSGDFLFFLSQPIHNSVDYEKTLSDLIFPLLSLAPEEQLDPEMDLPPVADITIEIGIAGKSYTLSFYSLKDGSFILTSNGYPGVYKIEQDLPFSSLEYRDLLNDSIYHSNVSEIQGIAIQDRVAGKDYNIELTGESVQLKGMINEVSVDYPALMDFFHIFLNTGIARELDTVNTIKTNESDTMSIQIYKKNGSIDRLEYISGREGEQILFINGTANFASYTKTILDIRNALTELITKDDAK